MMVKDSEGGLGTLATRRELHRDTAAEGFKFYIVEDISNHWKIQDELHLMDSENKAVKITSSYLGSRGNLGNCDMPSFWTSF